MKEYEVKKGDTLSNLAEKLGVPSAYALQSFHNFKGPIERGIGPDIQPGMILTIPEPHEVEIIKKNIAEVKNKNSETSSGKSPENSEQQEEEEEEKESKEKSAGEHDGKLFVAQKGKAVCDKGTQFPQFKVSSHKKHYINDQEGTEDYLAVTENDLQFNPPAVPFGNCSVKNGQPCTFAPAGKWKKFYEGVKVMDHALLTEISELQCSVSGKIKVMDHGQKAQLSIHNFKNADAKVHSYINPLVDLEEFIDELDGEQFYI